MVMTRSKRRRKTSTKVEGKKYAVKTCLLVEWEKNEEMKG
jgi:hypothetical protein